jgi:hypothetical protein
VFDLPGRLRRGGRAAPHVVPAYIPQGLRRQVDADGPQQLPRVSWQGTFSLSFLSPFRGPPSSTLFCLSVGRSYRRRHSGERGSRGLSRDIRTPFTDLVACTKMFPSSYAFAIVVAPCTAILKPVYSTFLAHPSLNTYRQVAVVPYLQYVFYQRALTSFCRDR